MGLSMLSPPACATQSSDGNRLEGVEFDREWSVVPPMFLRKMRFCDTCKLNSNVKEKVKERAEGWSLA